MVSGLPYSLKVRWGVPSAQSPNRQYLRAAMTPLRLRLKELRKKKGLTQRKLASLAGLRRATIISLELGQSSPRLATLDKLAAALEVPVGRLLIKRAT